MKIFTPPEYITIITYSRITGIENIKLLLNYISKYNLARDRIYKTFVENYHNLQTLWKEYGIYVSKFEDLKKINEKKEKALIQNEFYDIAYDVLLNAGYAEGVSWEVYATLKSLNALKLKVKELDKKLVDSIPNDDEIEFNLWKYITCIGRATKYDKGNRNIKLLSTNEARINLNIKWVNVPIWIKSRKYRYVIQNLIDNISNGNYIAYTARVIVNKEYVGGTSLPIEIHITVPIEPMYEIYPKIKVRESPLVAGHDVNSDRLNTVIIDSRNFKAIHWRTWWYTNASIKNINADKIWNEITQTIGNDIEFCRQRNCFYHVFEDYSLIGEWKLLDSLRHKKLRDTEANWRMITFRSSVIEKYGIELYLLGYSLPQLIHPKGTTQIAEEIHTLFGWDVHTTSAYLIACFGTIEKEMKQII